MLIPLDHLYTNYLDRDLWRVAADQYHDADEFGIEAALRWFARHDKAPFYLPPDVWDSLARWAWYNPKHWGGSYSNVRRYLEEHAPATCIISACLLNSGYFTVYQSSHNAVRFVVESYARCWEALQ